MFASCEGCTHFKKEGWAPFRGAGGPIRQGPCRIRSFYTHDAARWACDGRDRVEAKPEGKEEA